jgi:flagellar basal-body rod protein FlgF
MDRGLFVAMTGAKQIMQAQAVNNNNLANVSTVGFRADAVSFTSNPIYGPGYATRVNAVAGDAGTDFSSGVLSSTGNPLDISVNDEGFIAVQAADGKEAYTRAGDLRLTADGALVTGTGLPVLSESGPIVVPPASATTIGSDGTISVVPLGLSAAAQSQVDRIKLVKPALKSLQKGPDGLFRVKGGAKVVADESVTVSTGTLESSNVNAALSLVNMIELQRLYELQIKSLNSTDTNEQSAERLMLTS